MRQEQPLPRKSGGKPEFGAIQRDRSFSGSGERERVSRFVRHIMAVRAARAAGLGAGAECLVDDGLDGARTTAAFGAAAEAAVDLLWMARKVRRCVHSAADVMV